MPDWRDYWRRHPLRFILASNITSYATLSIEEIVITREYAPQYLITLPLPFMFACFQNVPASF